MYKLPKKVKNSTVYTGFKIVLGWKEVRKFLTKLSKDDYFIHQMISSYSSNDGYELIADFHREGFLSRVKAHWVRDGSRNLLRLKYKLDSLEIKDAPLQD